MRKRRYSGNDRHFGPFTYSIHGSGGYRPLGAIIDSGGGGEDGDRGCHLRLSALGRTLIVELPSILPDFRIRHVARSWDPATIERMGRNWYDEVFSRQYGFTISDNTLHAYFGPQTHDSITTKSKCYFLPWLHWRFVRQSWYGPTGQHIETLWETKNKEDRSAQWEWRHEFEKTLAKTRFEVEDFDGKRIGVSTHIEEREWRFGTGFFEWLSLFRRCKVRRTLEINFDHEVGPEKGSWKGGLMGTSIEMDPGELHEAAFRRYCDMEHRDRNGKYRIKIVSTLTATAPKDE